MQGGRNSWLYIVTHQHGGEQNDRVLKMWPSHVYSVNEEDLQNEVARLTSYRGNHAVQSFLLALLSSIILSNQAFILTHSLITYSLFIHSLITHSCIHVT